MIYLLTSLLVVGLSIAFFSKASGSLMPTRLNMSSYPFYLMLLTFFFGATSAVTGFADLSHLYKLSSLDVLVPGWYACMWAMLGVPLGMLFVNAMAGVDIQALTAIRARTPVVAVPGASQTALRRVLMMTTLAGAASLAYTLSQLPEIPLFNAIRGGVDAGTLAIQRGTSRLTGDAPVLRTVTELLVSYLQPTFFAALAYWFTWRQKRDLTWLLIVTPVVLLALSYNIVKTNLVFFISGIPLVLVYLRGRTSQTIVFVAGSTVTIVAVLAYVLFRDALGSGATITEVLIGILTGRVAVGQLISFYYCLDLFPRVFPHIGLSSTGHLIHEWLGLTYQPDYGIVVMSFFDPAGVDEGAAGHATAVFLGEAWANFGIIGLLLSPLLVGAFIQTVHIWFLRRPKTPLHAAFYAYLTYLFPLTSGIQAFYYPMWLVTIIAFAGLILAAAAIGSSTAHDESVVTSRGREPRYRSGVINGT